MGFPWGLFFLKNNNPSCHDFFAIMGHQFEPKSNQIPKWGSWTISILPLNGKGHIIWLFFMSCNNPMVGSYWNLPSSSYFPKLKKSPLSCPATSLQWPPLCHKKWYSWQIAAKRIPMHEVRKEETDFRTIQRVRLLNSKENYTQV